MADAAGSLVKSEEIRTGITQADGLMMFRGYDPNHIKDFVLVPSDDKCTWQQAITYLTDFAEVATDLHSARELLSLTGSIIQVNPGTLTPSTVITVVGKIIDTLDDLAGKRDAKGKRRFHFPVHLCCHKKYQPFSVTMTVLGTLQIQDKSPNDFVELDVNLLANNVLAHRKLRRDGSQLTGSRTLSLSDTPEFNSKHPLQCVFVTDSDFEIVVEIADTCHVDYDVLNPSIAGVRITTIGITITTSAECQEGKAPPLLVTPKESEPQTQPPGSETRPPKTEEKKAPPKLPQDEDF